MTFITSPTLSSEISAFDQVTQILKLEADAISKAIDQLQPSQVERAVDLLCGCQGKIILLGVGKSGLIARKIAATLTSIGTPALFLHPSDALHGDIGIVNSADVAIALSNSGETEEILGILPYLKRRQVPIIAIIGNLKSTLARNATAILEAGISSEACPLNLAPTASTTVALAIGDALAMTLMQVKQLTAQDFAFNHPAGRLGKRLTLTVGDLMCSGTQNPTISSSASWLDVLEALTQGGLGAVSVIDGRGHLLGIITDGDVRRVLQKFQQKDWETLVSNAIMTPNPISITAEVLAYEALQLMENRPSQISVLPVVDQENVCVGMIRLHDIIRSGLA
jgi:arabinose-5-phosphate isomerase